MKIWRSRPHIFLPLFKCSLLLIFRFTPQSIRTIPAPINSHLPSLCLVLLQNITDGDPQYVFIQPLDVFSKVNIFSYKLIQNSRRISLVSEEFYFNKFCVTFSTFVILVFPELTNDRTPWSGFFLEKLTVSQL